MKTLTVKQTKLAMSICHNIAGNPRYTNKRKNFRHVKYYFQGNLKAASNALKKAGLSHEYRESLVWCPKTLHLHVPLSVPFSVLRRPIPKVVKDTKADEAVKWFSSLSYWQQKKYRDLHPNSPIG